MRAFFATVLTVGVLALSAAVVVAATPPPGGSHQLGAVEGCTNQWLSTASGVFES